MRTKNFILFFFVCIFLFSCKKENTPEGNDNLSPEFKTFSVTLSDGTVVKGKIDKTKYTINLDGFADSKMIVKVDYKVSDNTTVSPLPESKIGKWEEKETFRLVSGTASVFYNVIITDFGKDDGGDDGNEGGETEKLKAIVNPDDMFGRQTKYHLIDLNGDIGKVGTPARGKFFFKDCGANGLRFPILCSTVTHISEGTQGNNVEGVCDEKVYSKVMNSLRNAKENYTGNDFQIFLGVKVLGNSKRDRYPAWVLDENDNIIPEKYARLYVDVIKYLKENGGHVVTQVALDKESLRLPIDQYAICVKELKRLCNENGLQVPQFVAPELLDPQGNKPSGWMNMLYDKKLNEHFDIFGNHYYARDHNKTGFGKLQYEFALANSDRTRPSWATEAHWDGRDDKDDLFGVHAGIGCMFDWTDLGLDAFMWWGFPNARGGFKSAVMIDYSVALLGSIPIRIRDHDGEETFDYKKLNTRAYIKGDEVNVFILNTVLKSMINQGKSYKDYVIELAGEYKISDKVKITQWLDTTSGDGNVIYKVPQSPNSVLVDLPLRSVTHLKFNINK